MDGVGSLLLGMVCGWTAFMPAPRTTARLRPVLLWSLILLPIGWWMPALFAPLAGGLVAGGAAHLLLRGVLQGRKAA